MDGRVYKLDYLDQISGNDADFIARMVKEFVLLAPLAVNAIKLEVEARNFQKLRLLVHQFAPQLDYLGLSDARKVLDEVEYLCVNNGAWGRVEDLLVTVYSQTERALIELREDFS